VAEPDTREGAPLDGQTGWRLRFGAFFGGQAASLIGSALTQFVLVWWITDTTGSVSALATAGMAALLPQALLGPLGGALADRWNRRILLMATDGFSAVCMGVLIVLFLTGSIEVWHAYVMMALRSAMQAFQGPAAAASTPMLVPASFLPRAAGLNQTLQGIVTVAAAPLGALAIAILPIGWALAIDVITAVFAIGALLAIKIPQPQREGATTGLFSEIREGFDVVWANAGLRALYLVLAAAVLVVMPSFTMVALLVKAHFGGGASHVALMEALTGAAMIIAGIAVAAVAPRRPILWIIGGFAVSCFALAATAMPDRDLFALAVAAWTVSGFAFVCASAPLTALLQSVVANRLQGRVFALLQTVMALAAPLGMVLAAPLGEVLGIRWLFIVLGLVGGLVSLSGLLSKSIRELDRR
jgi:DHA3 family macrolide efflux protein-like MFS transporter